MKTVYKWAALALVAVGLVTEGRAAVDGSNEASVKPELHLPSRWTVEADAQAHSVAGQGSPWIGIAGTYRIVESVQVGFRGFVPMSRTVDNSTYALQAFTRFRVAEGYNTDLFLEPDVAENFYNFAPSPSAGLAIGALNHFSPGLAIGVAGGLECAKYVLDSIGLEERSDVIVYPKVSLFADFTF